MKRSIYSSLLFFIFFFVLFYDFQNPLFGNESIYSRFSLSELPTQSQNDYEVLPNKPYLYNQSYNFQPVIMVAPLTRSPDLGNTKLIFYNSFERNVRIDKVVLEWCNDTQTRTEPPQGTEVKHLESNTTFMYYPDSAEQRVFSNSTIMDVGREKELDQINMVSEGKFQILSVDFVYDDFFDMGLRSRHNSSYNEYFCKFSLYEDNQKVTEGISNTVSNEADLGPDLFMESMVNY